MIYLYAIIDQPARPLAAIGGLDGTSVEMLTGRRIGAVISTVSAAPVAHTEANLWQHETIVEGLMAAHAVLPVRFGTLLADKAAVRAVLATHHAGFKANLARVHGHVELGLRVVWDDGSCPLAPPAGSSPPDHDGSRLIAIHSGRDYLLVRLKEQHRLHARRQRAEAFAADVQALLVRQATEDSYKIRLGSHVLLTAAYLVRRERIAAFRQEVESLATARPELCISCTGPWPPYHFVTQSIGGNGSGLAYRGTAGNQQ